MSATYDYRKYAVLYVDDEEQALKYFRKGMDKDFRVHTATNVADAIVLLEKEAGTIGVVITDQRMPGQLGVELLKRIRSQWPGIVRLLITAYSDIESAIESVNAGAIYKYITKPADLKELKQTLKAAMELFLDGCQRETLLKEKLEVMQRMVVADRVQSLAQMAGGISHHLRNSMTALSCFLEEAAVPKPGDPTAGAAALDPKFIEQLWTLAHKERERLLQIVDQVGQSVAAPSYTLSDEIEAVELLRLGVEAATNGLEGRAIGVSAMADLPKLRSNAQAVTQVIRILLIYAGRLGKPDGKLSVTVTASPICGAPGIAVAVMVEGPNWSENDVASFFTPFAFPESDPSDLGLDLMTAFSIAQRHGGDIVVHPCAPAGPGFELRLPANPESVPRPDLQNGLMQKLVTGLQSPAAGGRAA
jgi:two-component system probable response regulator PhcQ